MVSRCKKLRKELTFQTPSKVQRLDRALVVMLIGASLLLLTGCSDFVDRDQVNIVPEAAVTFETGHPVGQTFVAHHAGLAGVEIWLEPDGGSQGEIVLHLRADPQDAEDLAVATLSLAQVTAPGFHRFSFAPLRGSHGVYYYAFLEMVGDGAVRVGAGPGGAYLDGALYRDHEPLDAQMAFRLVYDPAWIVADLSLTSLKWMGYGVGVLVILFFSGYWIARGWALRKGLDFTSVLILSAASALAAWMVLLVWSNLVHFRLNATYVRFIVVGAVAGGLVCFVRDARSRGLNREFWLGTSFQATVTLWLVIGFSVGLRLWVGRGFVMLPGSDAYHHTLIAQLFAEQGGIPDHYEPYAHLISFSYHFGFHSIVALVRWLFESDLLSTTKLVALSLNGAIAATVALCSEQITGSRRSGIVAAALAGIVMVSPFCLLRWSRFTQTTGMFFLPLAVLGLLSDKRERVPLFSALLVAATGFAHSRIAFFWGILAGVVGTIAFGQKRWGDVKQIFKVGILGILLTLPWLVRIAWVQYDPYGFRITYPVLSGYNDLRRMEEPVLHFATNWPALFFVLVSAGIALGGKRRLLTLTCLTWCAVLVAGAFLSQRFGFSFWDAKTTLLSLSVPFAVLVGLGMHALETRGGQVWRFIQAGFWVLLLAGIVMAAGNLPGLIYTRDIYLRPGDQVAMDWIRENLPADAVFAVNAIQFEWSPGWLVGSDAGYWIPLLAERTSVLPPMLYPLEIADPSLATDVRTIQELLTAAEGSETTSEVMRRYGVTYIFTKTSSWPLNPLEMDGDPSLQCVLRQDQVWVFAVMQ